jgi:hypothetical protein
MRTWVGQAFASANPVRVGSRFPLIPAHSASKTRVNALMPGIQSRVLGIYDLGPRNGVPAMRASRGAPRGDERMLHGSTQPDRL